MKTKLLTLLVQFLYAASSSAAELDVIFKPSKPVIHLDSTRDVDGVTVYDHSEFSVTLKNNSSKSIEVEKVNFVSIGDIQKSGLGDVINYWPWQEYYTLEPRKSLTFSKVWGFTVDTPNSEMTYRFEIDYKVSGSKNTKQVVKELGLNPRL